MAADRGAFIDHSQSLNIFIARPNYGNITSMHFYGWQKVCAVPDGTFIFRQNSKVLFTLLRFQDFESL